MAHLQTLVQDNLLALKTDILGPLDEAGQVALGGQVTAWMSACILGGTLGRPFRLTGPRTRDVKRDIPMPKVRDFFSKRGLVSFLAAFLVPYGVAAGLDFPLAALGCDGS
jgi:hypothetical protein